MSKMTPENFCYWLQGYYEMTGSKGLLSFKQQAIVHEHLQLVFEKVTPDHGQTPYNDIPDADLEVPVPPEPACPENENVFCTSICSATPPMPHAV